MDTERQSGAISKRNRQHGAAQNPVQIGLSRFDRKHLPADALIIIPVRNQVLLPGAIVPIALGREGTIAAAREADDGRLMVGLLLQRDAKTDSPAGGDLHHVGTVARILRYVKSAEGAHQIVCRGEQRFRVIEFLDGYPFLVARIARHRDPENPDPEIEARVMQIRQRILDALELMPHAPEELAATAQCITSAPLLADFVAGLLELATQEKQEVLETLDLQDRLDRVSALLSHRIDVLRVRLEIDLQTQERVGERQREVLLREQLKTIQNQLGETHDANLRVEELRHAIDRAGMPAAVELQARAELRRLGRIADGNGEYAMLLTYLEWLTELPWSISSEDRIDIAEARKILDENHYGLQKVKRRMLEYLAVRKLNPQGSGPILCFVGPPGVGKTSLGQSIAKATGRKFERLSLGGVHDEADIRGHRRTYVGAMPGNIIRALRDAGSNNCVMMLDEIDKLGSGASGNPAAGLLEVLDPEQNAAFRDNYLALPFDVSKVMFICTANQRDLIPAPLRDRLEIIEIHGYTEEEKTQIARRYLVGRQLSANGLLPSQCEITDDALHLIIRDYTREAGVRNLEREMAAIFRHVAVRIGEAVARQVRIDAPDLAAILGASKFESECAMRTSLPGVAAGLAWTPAGGEILFIEATRHPGHGKLILTGQLGEVMKESAQAALTLLKVHTGALRIAPGLFDKTDIHIHVPGGAIPKDGPSAGIAMFIALASLFTDKAVYSDRAMAGEISLRGLVLPVGGIKEKVLAALRAGINTVLLPSRNRKDLDEIPEDARRKLEFVWLDTVDDAMNAAIIGQTGVATLAMH